MIAQVQTTQVYSPEEYLALEIISETRNEYIHGEIIPMARGMPNHNQIVLNIAGTLNFSLKRQPYRVFVVDQRLWIPQERSYTYPDVMVVSGDFILQEGRKDTITNPTLIIEVLSKSTGKYDQTEKFTFYRSLPTFQEYLLVDQHHYSVQHYVKTGVKKWEFQEYDTLEEEIKFDTIPCTIALADIYDKVDITEPVLPENKVIPPTDA
ncbi:MAG: Uma2 family endonuclease [Coleofasciculaceae cyanobacterium SM2_1_6]|nr:Uma2 family endonuclease [Coleofasciculaceae cyanobacterium SM2_1_6]